MRDGDDEPQFQKTRPRSARIWRRRTQEQRDHMRSDCSTKRRFRDAHQAQRFVRGLKKGLGARFEPQRIYHCAFCNGFHTTGKVDRLAEQTDA